MTREIPLTQGHVALVDDKDYERFMAMGKWQVSLCGGRLYAARGHQRMHRLLIDAPLVDHINGNGLDNRRANLRPATGTQNNANSRRSRANTSGYKGVSLYRRTGRWRAYLGTRPREVHLGYFDTPEQAARAYDAAATQAWGEYARLNFPKGSTA